MGAATKRTGRVVVFAPALRVAAAVCTKRGAARSVKALSARALYLFDICPPCLPPPVGVPPTCEGKRERDLGGSSASRRANGFVTYVSYRSQPLPSRPSSLGTLARVVSLTARADLRARHDQTVRSATGHPSAASRRFVGRTPSAPQRLEPGDDLGLAYGILAGARRRISVTAPDSTCNVSAFGCAVNQAA